MKVQTNNVLPDLSNFALLRNLDANQTQVFLNNIVFRKAKKGDVLYSKADSSRIFFLFSGVVKLVEIKENGAEIVKDILTENDIFGEFSFDRKPLHFEYAKALSNVNLLTIDGGRFREIIKSNPQVLLNFHQSLLQKINRLEARCINLSLSNSRERLLHFLSNIVPREDTSLGGAMMFKNYLTQDEVAKMIFVSRQTLSRLLKELRKSGELTYTRKKIEIRNPGIQNLTPLNGAEVMLHK